MYDEDREDETILEIRERSGRYMQAAFGLLALIATAAGALVHFVPEAFAFVEEAPEAVAHCFLVMGLCYAATMLLWDWLFAQDDVEHDAE